MGYFDIFVVEPRLDRTVHPILYLWREGGSRVIEAPVETVDKVVKVRAAKKLASSNAIQLCGGFVVRQSKGAKEPEIRLKMFDLIPGERTKSGFDCRQTSTFGVAIAKEKLAGLGAKVPGGNSKALLCTALAVEMGQISKQNLLFPPYLHPIL